MQQFSQERMDAPEKDRTSLFVYFDFSAFPMRVHSGQGEIEWNDHQWTGVGDVLRQDSYSQSFAMSAHSYSRGEMAASLPVTPETKEVVMKEYYRDRRLEWAICMMDQDGGVIKPVHFNRGRIVQCRLKEDVITFEAESDRLDSVEKKDARHKKRVEAIRQQFKWDVGETVSSSWAGWLLNVLSLSLGVIIDVSFPVFSQSYPQSNKAKVGGTRKDVLVHDRAPDSRHEAGQERIQNTGRYAR